MKTGEVGVLNVGCGDTKLTFDKSNPAERIRAARIVADMLRRGYALLVDRGDGKYQRVHAFDEETCCYIIADFDPVTAGEADKAEAGNGEKSAAETNTAPIKKKRGRPAMRNLPADKTHAVAVARSAGG